MHLGINVDPNHGFKVADIAYSRAHMVRLPLWEDTGFRYAPWLRALKRRRIQPVVVLDRRAFPTDNWCQHLVEYKTRYPMVHYWQIGNEADQADQDADPSWHLPPQILNEMLASAREVFGRRKYLICAGMTSGDPSYLDQIDLGLVDAIAVHPYGARPYWDIPSPEWGFGNLDEAIEGYRLFEKPIWVTEFGGEEGLFENEHERAVYHSEMLRSLAALDVEAALLFCWSDLMVPGFGMLDGDGNPKETFAAFRDALP